MPTRTSYRSGTFCWVDLSTPDPEAAKAFYAELFGWSCDRHPIARLEGEAVAAIVEQDAAESGRGVPPHWNNYVSVEDADASVARAGELGATILGDAFDIADEGRIGVVIDPTGAALCMWQPRSHIGAGIVNAPGALTWNELGTADVEAATGFYTALFGWQTQSVTPDGGYRIVKLGERSNGSIRQQGPEEREGGAPPFWMPYFVAADSVDVTATTAGELGGAAMLGPLDLPNGGRVAALADPQGAVFGVLEGELDD